ncbi:MAG: SurA N-terminal domain-containing protein [Gammaproteobacteria bacterium]
MLQNIREAITGWMAYVVIAVLVVPFALFGIGDYFGVFGAEFAVKVGDTEIPATQYRDRFNQRYTQLRDAYGDRFDPALIDEPRLRQEVLDQMVDEELLYQYAYQRGFRVSDTRIVREIHSIEAFQDAGRFSQERYVFVLRSIGENPTSFERGLRRSLAVSQLQQALTGSAFVPPARIDAIIRLADQRREFAWAEVTAQTFSDAIEITDEQIAAYYEANAPRYMTDETVTVEYLALDAAIAGEAVEVDEQGLRAFYEEQRRAATAGEERRASHILITDEGRTDDEARALAEGLKAQLDSGASFAELAAEHSDDVDSAEQGGDLGWIERGAFMEAFENALFQLDEGEVSPPVRTGFGWHLIRADEVRAETYAAFEDMREELIGPYRQRAGEQRFHDLVERLAALAFENPDSLEPAADALDLEIQRVEGVTESRGTGALAQVPLRRAAFSPEVLEEGYNSDLIELTDGSVAVVRVADRQRPRLRDLAEVRDRIEQTLVAQEARRRAAATGEQIVERARAGEALVEVARALDAEWHSARSTGRSDTSTPPEVLDAVFRAPTPTDEQQVIRGLQTAGGYAVFQLYDVAPGMPESLDEDQRAGLTRAMESRVANAEFEALLASLRAEADIQYGTNLFDDF